MRRNFLLLTSLALLFGFVLPVRAQSPVEWKDIAVGYEFGKQITFSARLESSLPIQAASLLIQMDGDQAIRPAELTIAADGTTRYVYPIQSGILRSFSDLFFWYHVSLKGGETFDSPHYSFQYADNRYAWQTTSDSGLRLHWVSGDTAFGQEALNAAHAGYQAIQNLIPVTNNDPIDIYIYASATAVQDTLALGGQTWIGGHASPNLGVVLVSIAPGETQSIEMERQIPHELAHILLYRLTGSAYSNLPGWLSEGISSQAEQYPNADYTQVLLAAAKNNSLFQIADLCGPFPIDASGAILAYAESDSFIRYLHETYGSSGLQDLIKAYSDGLSCDKGTERALGSELSDLDLKWRQTSLGENNPGLALHNLLPYVIFLGLVLIIPIVLLILNWKKKAPHADKNPK